MQRTRLPAKSPRCYTFSASLGRFHHGPSPLTVWGWAVHDPIAASYADRVIFLGDGRVVADRARMGASEIAAFMLSIEQVA